MSNASERYKREGPLPSFLARTESMGSYTFPPYPLPDPFDTQGVKTNPFGSGNVIKMTADLLQYYDDIISQPHHPLAGPLAGLLSHKVDTRSYSLADPLTSVRHGSSSDGIRYVIQALSPEYDLADLHIQDVIPIPVDRDPLLFQVGSEPVNSASPLVAFGNPLTQGEKLALPRLFASFLDVIGMQATPIPVTPFAANGKPGSETSMSFADWLTSCQNLKPTRPLTAGVPNASSGFFTTLNPNTSGYLWTFRLQIGKGEEIVEKNLYADFQKNPQETVLENTQGPYIDIRNPLTTGDFLIGLARVLSHRLSHGLHQVHQAIGEAARATMMRYYHRMDNQSAALDELEKHLRGVYSTWLFALLDVHQRYVSQPLNHYLSPKSQMPQSEIATYR